MSLSGFCCVSCVPASCVHIWFVSCPCFMSLWVNACPAVFVSLSVINLCILVHAWSVWFRLVYSLHPGVSCLLVLPCPALSCLVLPCPALSCLVLPCPALSCLDVIKYYHLSLYPRLRVPVPPSCVHCDSHQQTSFSLYLKYIFPFC